MCFNRTGFIYLFRKGASVILCIYSDWVCWGGVVIRLQVPGAQFHNAPSVCCVVFSTPRPEAVFRLGVSIWVPVKHTRQ